VDRQVVEDDPLYDAVYGELANHKAEAKSWLGALDKWWDYENLHKLWAKKFRQYLQFVNRCTTISTKLGYYAQPIQVAGIKLDMIGLNSALMSWRDGEDLERGLWIGKPQLDELEGSLSGDSSFRITLVHHPREALHYQDVAWERLQRISHIMLHGHMHKTRAISMGEPEREHVCLSGGSVHQDGVWHSQRYSYGCLNPETKELDLYLRMTKPGAYPVYIRDNQTYPDAGADGHIRRTLGEKSFA
jgi:hypothetical protein